MIDTSELQRVKKTGLHQNGYRLMYRDVEYSGLGFMVKKDITNLRKRQGIV